MGCTGKDWGRGENSRGEDEGREKEAPSQSWNQISFSGCGGGRHFMRSRNTQREMQEGNGVWRIQDKESRDGANVPPLLSLSIKSGG